MNKFLLFLLFLLPLSLIGQVESQFNGTLNVFSASRIGFTNTFTISGIFSSTTTSYTSSNSATGDIVQVQSGTRFYWMHIYSIASNSGGVITCNVRDSSSTLTTFPIGKWSIFRPTTNLRLPLSPDGETNASRSATFNTLALRVDDIQQQVSSSTNCERTITKTAHGFSKWTPVYWTGANYVRPPYDSLVPDYIVVDSLTANTFKVASCGTYATVLPDGLYWFTSQSPGYSLTPDTTKAPLFQVIDSVLVLNPIIGFNLMATGDVTSSVLADTAAAIRADFPSSTNIYNSDGELTGNRELTGAYTLKLNPTTINLYNKYNLPNATPISGANRKNIQVWTNGVPGWENRYQSDTIRTTTRLSMLLGGFIEFTPTATPRIQINLSNSNTSVSTLYDNFSSISRIVNTLESSYSVSALRKFASSSFNVNRSGANVQSTVVFEAGQGSGGVISSRKLAQVLIRYDSSTTGIVSALGLRSDSLSGGSSRYHQNGFFHRTSVYSGSQFRNIDATPTWATRTTWLSSSASIQFDWIRVRNLDAADTSTTNAVQLYNGKYGFVNAAPSTVSGAVSTQIQTGDGTNKTPSWRREKNGAISTTTDANGDITVTIPTMPDATYTTNVTITGTTLYGYTVHTKTTTSFKVRFYNTTTTTALGSGVSINFDYDVKDY